LCICCCPIYSLAKLSFLTLQCYFDNDESRVTQELVTKCNNVCRSRLCCFDSYRLENSCRAAVGENECELFALCEQMITKDGGVVKDFIELDLKEFDNDSPGVSTPEQLIEKEVFDAVSLGSLFYYKLLLSNLFIY
jgi:hypothetical protein